MPHPGSIEYSDTLTQQGYADYSEVLICSGPPTLICHVPSSLTLLVTESVIISKEAGNAEGAQV